MKLSFRTMRSFVVIGHMLAMIISSLCYPAREFRLPPVPTPGQSGDLYGSVIKAPDKTTLAEYGPPEVPVQLQKRTKRQALDLDCPDSGAGRKVVTLPISYLSEYESAATGSLLFVPRPEGRAPPSFS